MIQKCTHANPTSNTHDTHMHTSIRTEHQNTQDKRTRIHPGTIFVLHDVHTIRNVTMHVVYAAEIPSSRYVHARLDTGHVVHAE